MILPGEVWASKYNDLMYTIASKPDTNGYCHATNGYGGDVHNVLVNVSSLIPPKPDLPPIPELWVVYSDYFVAFRTSLAEAAVVSRQCSDGRILHIRPDAPPRWLDNAGQPLDGGQ